MGMLSLAAVCLTSIVAAQPEGTAKDKGRKIGPNEFRVATEVILEPNGSTAVYRARVWTLGKQNVLLCMDGSEIAMEGDTRPEPGGKLYRTDFVIIVTLRDDPDARGKRQRFERLYASGGGQLTLGGETNPGAKLGDNCKVAAGESFANLDSEVRIGNFFEQKVEVVARKPRPKR